MTTVKSELNTTGWTEIANAGQGFITNCSNNVVLVTENTSQPLDSVTFGHALQPMGDWVRFELKAGFRVYARALKNQLAIGTNPFVIVTPD